MKREKRQLKRNERISSVSGTALVVLLTVFLIYMIVSVMNLTSRLDDIEEHPFRVLNAGGKLQNDVDNVRIRLEQLSHINTPEVVDDIRRRTDEFYADGDAQLEVIREAYLGDPEDVVRLQELLEELHRQQDSFLDYAAEEERSPEEITAGSRGEMAEAGEKFDRQLETILSHAREKFRYFYDQAKASGLWSMAVSCVIFAVVLAVLLIYQHLLKWQTECLRNQNQLFDLLSRTVSHVFMINEPDHPERNFISENAGRILGFEPDPMDISPALLFDYMDEADRKTVVQLFDTHGETCWNAIFHYRHPNLKEEKIFALQTQRIRTDGREQFITVLTDETDMVRTQKDLEQARIRADQANRAKSEFLSRMSHEIRTPMNGIMGMVMLAQQNGEDRERVRECLGKIRTASVHLLNLINDVLDMSKIESGKMEISRTEFDLRTLIESLNEVTRSQARDKGIAYDAVLVGDVEEKLLGDPLRVNQILMNLLSNALKFTPGGGAITLRVIRLQQQDRPVWLKFEVQDTGCGIAPENFQRIFRAFEQENSDVSQAYGGTGLGLSISKRFAEMMGGKISVSSVLGKGATFSVVLPFERAPEECGCGETFRGLRALIADGDPDGAAHTALLLEKLGVSADTVCSGGDAAARAAQAGKRGIPYDLCLIDRSLRPAGGAETIRRILAEPGERKPAAVLMDDGGDGETQEEARAAGAFAVVAKPLFCSALQELLARITGGKQEDPEEDGPPSGDFRGYRFLVAEDNELNMEIAKGILEAAGAVIETAADGREAVERFAGSPPDHYDLILMDIQMPVMNGYDATKAIRSLERRDAGTVPILAMTANAFSEDVEKSLACGMNGHISKPVDLTELFGKIRRSLGEKSGTTSSGEAGKAPLKC